MEEYTKAYKKQALIKGVQPYLVPTENDSNSKEQIKFVITKRKAYYLIWIFHLSQNIISFPRRFHDLHEGNNRIKTRSCLHRQKDKHFHLHYSSF